MWLPYMYIDAITPLCASCGMQGYICSRQFLQLIAYCTESTCWSDHLVTLSAWLFVTIATNCHAGYVSSRFRLLSNRPEQLCHELISYSQHIPNVVPVKYPTVCSLGKSQITGCLLLLCATVGTHKHLMETWKWEVTAQERPWSKGGVCLMVLCYCTQC